MIIIKCGRAIIRKPCQFVKLISIKSLPYKPMWWEIYNTFQDVINYWTPDRQWMWIIEICSYISTETKALKSQKFTQSQNSFTTKFKSRGKKTTPPPHPTHTPKKKRKKKKKERKSYLIINEYSILGLVPKFTKSINWI